VSESQQRPARRADRARRRLTPSDKYEIYVQVLTPAVHPPEAAEKWSVDRSTVIGWSGRSTTYGR
jgi:hypothetical protein